MKTWAVRIIQKNGKRYWFAHEVMGAEPYLPGLVSLFGNKKDADEVLYDYTPEPEGRGWSSDSIAKAELVEIETPDP
jgi:hypothetical protein